MCNNKYSKKTNVWLLRMEQNDGVFINFARNGREYRLLNYPTSLWTVIVKRRILIMSILGVIGTAAHVCRFLTSSQPTATT